MYSLHYLPVKYRLIVYLVYSLTFWLKQNSVCAYWLFQVEIPINIICKIRDQASFWLNNCMHWNAFFLFCQAEASVKEDKDRILKLIEEGPGFHHLNCGRLMFCRSCLNRCPVDSCGSLTIDFGSTVGRCDWPLHLTTLRHRAHPKLRCCGWKIAGSCTQSMR